jgi:hypothetical protein
MRASGLAPRRGEPAPSRSEAPPPAASSVGCRTARPNPSRSSSDPVLGPLDPSGKWEAVGGPGPSGTGYGQTSGLRDGTRRLGGDHRADQSLQLVPVGAQRRNRILAAPEVLASRLRDRGAATDLPVRLQIAVASSNRGRGHRWEYRVDAGAEEGRLPARGPKPRIRPSLWSLGRHIQFRAPSGRAARRAGALGALGSIQDAEREVRHPPARHPRILEKEGEHRGLRMVPVVGKQIRADRDDVPCSVGVLLGP